MRSSRAPLLLAGLALGSFWLLPSAAPEAVSGDAEAVAPSSLPGRLVVDYVDNADPDAIAALEARLGLHLDWASDVSFDEALRAGEVGDPAAAIAALSDEALVEVAEPEMEMTALGFPNDPLYPQQWNFSLVNAPVGWRVGGGAGVIVAVIDTGVSPLPDLPAERILKGRSFVPGVSSSADDQGHGTHVASTIAEATNNGAGAAGIAPNVTILPMKVLASSGGGMSTWIAAAIDAAVDDGAQVINLSLGGGHSEVLVNAVEKARKAGVVVVAAAGNSGREGLGSPADAKAAIAVSAVGPDDVLAPYSTWGKGVEISAPGGNKNIAGGGILQSTIDPSTGGQTFSAFQGTSMASPHVAAAAAVLFGAGAQSADEVERFLKQGADGRGDALHYGAGRLDVGASVRALLLYKQGLLFAVGAIVSAALASLGGRSRALAGVLGGAVAGGLFFLPLLPLPPSAFLVALSKPFLALPGPFWSGFPLWQSALVPVLAGFLFAPFRRLAPLGLALTGGLGAAFLYGAATGHSDLWWMPLGLDKTWLAVNGTIALLMGLAVAGAQRLTATSEE